MVHRIYSNTAFEVLLHETTQVQMFTVPCTLYDLWPLSSTSLHCDSIPRMALNQTHATYTVAAIALTCTGLRLSIVGVACCSRRRERHPLLLLDLGGVSVSVWRRGSRTCDHRMHTGVYTSLVARFKSITTAALHSNWVFC